MFLPAHTHFTHTQLFSFPLCHCYPSYNFFPFYFFATRSVSFSLFFFSSDTCSYSTLPKKEPFSFPLLIVYILYPPIYPPPPLAFSRRWTLYRSNINTVPRNRQHTCLPSRQKRTPGLLEEQQQQLPLPPTTITTTRLLGHHRIVVIRVCEHVMNVENARYLI